MYRILVRSEYCTVHQCTIRPPVRVRAALQSAAPNSSLAKTAARARCRSTATRNSCNFHRQVSKVGASCSIICKTAMFSLLCAACKGLWGNETCSGTGSDQIDRMASGMGVHFGAGGFSSISDRALAGGRASRSVESGVYSSRDFFHATCGC